MQISQLLSPSAMSFLDVIRTFIELSILPGLWKFTQLLLKIRDELRDINSALFGSQLGPGIIKRIEILESRVL